ncbi:MAG: putative bifunctional diguanylate cyclase/phosphodiesterase [Actinomycetales bacterium]
MRRASRAALVCAAIAYAAGLVPALLDSDYDTSFPQHLVIRGVSCGVAAILIGVGIIVNKPERKAPWILLLLLVVSYTLRPIIQPLGFIMAGDGWLVFVLIAVQRSLDIAAITTIVWLRKTSRITDTRIEIAIILMAYAAVVVPFVAMPSVHAFADNVPITLAHVVVAPVCYIVSTAMVARLIFIDILRGRAFQLLVAGWLANLAGDVIAHNVLELSGWAFGAAAFDSYPVASFLWAAACLHPSMHEVSRPATAARGNWSIPRSFAIVTAGMLPLVVPVLVTHTALSIRIYVALLGTVILLLLIVRARSAVAAHVAAQEHLRELSLTDPLTHLLNRRGLIDRAERTPGPLGLAYLDLDGFKLINDAHGHDYGDKLLIEAGQRLAGIGPPVVASARIGGDEFALLFTSTSPDAVLQMGRAIEAAFAPVFHIDDGTLQVSASAGVALLSAGDESGQLSPDSVRAELVDLLQRADIAQYYAKAGGGGTQYYSAQMRAERVRQDHILELLKGAEGNGAFWLDYQAIVDLREGRCAGAECLARLRSDALGSVSPVEFIPLAEQHGQIIELGRWVFVSVLRDVLEAIDEMPEDFHVSVNVSPLQLRSDEFMDVILAAARHTSVATARIRIEVTETALVDTASLERLRTIRAAGYSVAIDDFGSEHASFQNLCLLGADVLKIDKSFTQRIVDDQASRTIVQHVIDLAHALDISVVTEGVERESERQLLSAMNCHYGQGFLWDRPAPGLRRVLQLARQPYSGSAVPAAAVKRTGTVSVGSTGEAGTASGLRLGADGQNY